MFCPHHRNVLIIVRKVVKGESHDCFLQTGAWIQTVLKIRHLAT